MIPETAMNKYLYKTRETEAVLGIGTQKLYDLINNGTLDARRFGKRTYITGASIEAFVASLPAAVTPTLAKAGHGRWSGRNPWSGVQEDEAKNNRR
jgi:hypothetical protein